MIKENKLKVGDTIKCHDAMDMVNAHEELAKCDIMADFLYELDGQKGYWLEIIEVCVKVPTLDEIKQSMCDKYCKFPNIISSQDELEKICADCPLDSFEV